MQTLKVFDLRNTIKNIRYIFDEDDDRPVSFSLDSAEDGRRDSDDDQKSEAHQVGAQIPEN